MYCVEGVYTINLTGAGFPRFIVLVYAMLLSFADAEKLWMLFSVFRADSSIAPAQLSSSRNTQREQDSRGGSRGLALRGNERDGFRSSGDWKSWWNCLYWEYLVCFLLGLIYYDKAPASRWIIEELRRKLPQDDELCPQSGDIVWEQFLLCSPAQDPVVFLPGILLEWGGTTKQKELIRAREKNCAYDGMFHWIFSISQTKRFPSQLSLLFCLCCLCTLCWMNILLSSSSSPECSPPWNLVEKLSCVSVNRELSPKGCVHLNVLTSFLFSF